MTPQGAVGSNPTLSANRFDKHLEKYSRGPEFFFIIQKHRLSYGGVFVCRLSSSQKLSVSVLEALAAINGAIVVGLEGNLALLTALCANSGEHLASASLATACLTSGAAIAASLRLVGEALLSVEFLLASRENELLSAILADQCLVSVHVIPSILFVHFLHIYQYYTGWNLFCQQIYENICEYFVNYSKRHVISAVYSP